MVLVLIHVYVYLDMYDHMYNLLYIVCLPKIPDTPGSYKTFDCCHWDPIVASTYSIACLASNSAFPCVDASYENRLN